MAEIVRTSISLPRELLDGLDTLIERTGIKSRSKAIAEAISLFLAERAWLMGDEDLHVIGSLTLIYRHEQVYNQMLSAQHRHGHVIRSTSHVHLDNGRCLEVLMVSGPLSEVREVVKDLERMKGVDVIKTFLTPIKASGPHPHAHE